MAPSTTSILPTVSGSTLTTRSRPSNMSPSSTRIARTESSTTGRPTTTQVKSSSTTPSITHSARTESSRLASTPSSSAKATQSTAAPWTTSLTRLNTGQAPGGVHQNFSTPVPPISQSQRDNGDTSSGPANTTTIIVGVLVPLIVIGIIALSIYIWYRKKYPVRMVIGKDFSTFTNPAYSKRASTLTLVRNDGNHVFEQLNKVPVGNSIIKEADEENIDAIDGRDNQAFVPESPVYENLNTSSPEPTAGVVENTQETVVLISEQTTNIARERPRKKAVLIKQEDLDDLSNGFELVTESDLGKRRESELSYGNESTDTHTISLSFADTFDDRFNKKTRSQSEDIGRFIDYKLVGFTGKARSQSDSMHQTKSHSSQGHENKTNASSLTDIPIAGRIVDADEDEFLHLENAIRGETENIPQEILNEISELTELTGKNSLERPPDTVIEIQGLESEHTSNPFETEMKTVSQNEASSSEDSFEVLNNETESLEQVKADEKCNILREMESHNSNMEMETVDERKSMTVDQTDMDQERSVSPCNFTPKRLSLQLSKENIVLDSVPQTPTVLVKDSIIFEPETPIPVYLDNSAVSPRRGRRAFTLNDIMSKVNPSSDNIHGSDEKSKSSPEIFLTQTMHVLKSSEGLGFKSDTLGHMDTALSDPNIGSTLREKTEIINEIQNQKWKSSVEPAESVHVDTSIESINHIDESIQHDRPETADPFKGFESDPASHTTLVPLPETYADKAIPEFQSNEMETKCFSSLDSSSNSTNESSSPLELADTLIDPLITRSVQERELNQEFSETTPESNILRSSTPTNNKGGYQSNPSTDAEDESHGDMKSDKDTVENNKKRIISASFQFDTDEEETSVKDISSESIESSRSTIDSTDYSGIPKGMAKSMDQAFEDGVVLDKVSIERSFNDSATSPKSDMTRSSDSTMSWEILNKDIDLDTNTKEDDDMDSSSNQDDNGHNETQDKKVNYEYSLDELSADPASPTVLGGAKTPTDSANISWDMIEDPEDNSEC